MRTEKQREASRVNGGKSRGPTTPEGKGITRFNGMKHGLRAEHVVVPGEDPAEFEAERNAWLGDWRPASHTRAVLVERAAVASWRLRRCVRVEAERLGEVAAAAIRRFDDDRLARVERTVDRFADDPAAALAVLRSEVAGVDRLLRTWRALGDVLAAGPAGWDQPGHHQRLLCLLGHGPDTSWIGAGPQVEASWRLLGINNRRAGIDPPAAGEPEALADGLRLCVALSIAELEERRAALPDAADDRRSAVAAALADDTRDAQVRHRYEMAHDRALRSIVAQLLALSRSDADLNGDDGDSPAETGSSPADSPPEPPDSKPKPEAADTGFKVGTNDEISTCGESPGEAPGSVGAEDAGVVPSPVATPDRPATCSKPAPEPAGSRRMRR